MVWFDSEMLGVWVGAILTLIVYSYLLGDNPLYRLAEHIFVGSAVAYVAVFAYHQILRPQLIEPLAQAPAANALLFIPLILSVLLLLRVGATPLTGVNSGSPLQERKHPQGGYKHPKGGYKHPQGGYKPYRAIRSWGNLALAYLFGVGAALAISGAVLGTFIPQLRATMVSLSPRQDVGDFIDHIILVVGTISVLLYFRFGQAQWGLRPKTPTDRTQSPLRLGAWVAHCGAWLGRIMLMITFGALFANTVMARVTLLVERVRFLLEVFGK